MNWHRVRIAVGVEDTLMNTVVGIFNSFADAKRAAAMLRSLGVDDEHLSVFSPQTLENEIETNMPTSDTEQADVGTAVGGAAGGAVRVAGGLQRAMSLAPW